MGAPYIYMTLVA